MAAQVMPPMPEPTTIVSQPPGPLQVRGEAAAPRLARRVHGGEGSGSRGRRQPPWGAGPGCGVELALGTWPFGHAHPVTCAARWRTMRGVHCRHASVSALLSLLVLVACPGGGRGDGGGDRHGDGRGGERWGVRGVRDRGGADERERRGSGVDDGGARGRATPGRRGRGPGRRTARRRARGRRRGRRRGTTRRR
jgi:hypothetical protein